MKQVAYISTCVGSLLFRGRTCGNELESDQSMFCTSGHISLDVPLHISYTAYYPSCAMDILTTGSPWHGTIHILLATPVAVGASQDEPGDATAKQVEPGPRQNGVFVFIFVFPGQCKLQGMPQAVQADPWGCTFQLSSLEGHPGLGGEPPVRGIRMLPPLQGTGEKQMFFFFFNETKLFSSQAPNGHVSTVAGTQICLRGHRYHDALFVYCACASPREPKHWRWQVDNVKKSVLPAAESLRAFFGWQRPMWMYLLILILLFRSYLSLEGFLEEDSWCHFAITVFTMIRLLTGFMRLHGHRSFNMQILTWASA